MTFKQFSILFSPRNSTLTCKAEVYAYHVFYTTDYVKNHHVGRKTCCK